MVNFIETVEEASKGGFQNIKKIRGLLVAIDVVDPPSTWKDATKQLIQFTLNDAVILERFDPDDDFELKEGKFTFSYTYAEPGKKPNAVSAYMKTIVSSAAKAGKKPSQLIGQVITLEKIPVVGFTDRETGEPVMYVKYFSLVTDEGADSVNVKTYIKGLVAGKNLKAALRELIVDSRAKQFPDFKEALQKDAEKFALDLGLTIVDGVFSGGKTKTEDSQGAG